MEEVIDCDFFDLLSDLYKNSGESAKAISQLIKKTPEGTVERIEEELDLLIQDGDSKKITSFNNHLTFLKNLMNHGYESEDLEFEEELL